MEIHVNAICNNWHDLGAGTWFLRGGVNVNLAIN